MYMAGRLRNLPRIDYKQFHNTGEITIIKMDVKEITLTEKKIANDISYLIDNTEFDELNEANEIKDIIKFS